MKLLQKFLKGHCVLEIAESPINGRIIVDEDLFGRRRLLVGGISQSGLLVEKIWVSIIKPLSDKATKSCLIL